MFIEAEANKAAGKYDNASIDFQIEFYKKEGLTPYSEAKLPITSGRMKIFPFFAFPPRIFFIEFIICQLYFETCGIIFSLFEQMFRKDVLL